VQECHAINSIVMAAAQACARHAHAFGHTCRAVLCRVAATQAIMRESQLLMSSCLLRVLRPNPGVGLGVMGYASPWLIIDA
jgi:hypothetical protein